MCRIFAVFALAAIGGAQDQTDAEKLKGEWWCSSLIIDGEKQKTSFASKIRLTITDTDYREHLGGKDLSKYRYEAKSPFLRFELPDKTYFYGRFERKGDKLTICYPGPIEGHQPLAPAEFSAPAGSKRNLSTWERVKD